MDDTACPRIQSCWTYALLAGLDSSLPPEHIPMLRNIMRRCITVMAMLVCVCVYEAWKAC